MPGSRAPPAALAADPALANARFEHYKLRAEHAPARTAPLPAGAALAHRALFNGAVPFKKLRARSDVNRLTAGDSGRAVFVAEDLTVHEVDLDLTTRILAKLPEPTDVPPSERELPFAKPLAGCLVASDGAGTVYTIAHTEAPPAATTHAPLQLLDATPARALGYTLVEADARVAERAATYTSKLLRFRVALVALSAEPGVARPAKVIAQVETVEQPVHARIVGDDAFIIGVAGPVKHLSISEQEQDQAVPQSVGAAPPPTPQIPRYSWQQTRDDVTITIPLAAPLSKSDVSCTFTSKALRLAAHPPSLAVEFNNDAFYAPIDADESTWTLAAHELVLHIAKHESSPARWLSLFDPDPHRVPETVSPGAIDAARAALAQFTSDTPFAHPQDELAAPPLHPEQALEQCDYEASSVALHHATASSLTSTSPRDFCCPTFDAAHLAFKNDVDAAVFTACLPHSTHVATMSAIAFIAASKRDRKFVRVSSDARRCVILDAGGRVAYCYAVDGLASDVGAQRIVDIDTGEDALVLGVQGFQDASGLRVLVLKDTGLAVISL